MKSREILRRLVRRFGLLIALTLLGGVAGAVYAVVKTPTYTAKAYVVTIGSAGESITALNYAQAYGRIATTGPVLATAGEKLGADRSGLNRVTASTSPDAPVVEITATGASAARSATVANAVASSLIALGDTRKTETKVSLAMLAAATPPAKPTSPKPPLELVIGAAGGLLIGGLAVLAGVGRSTSSASVDKPEETPVAAEETTRVKEPTRYDVTTSDEEVEDARPQIERYGGVWRAKKPKELTAVPDEEPVAPPPASAPPASVPQQVSTESVNGRIVGRAVVFRVEEK
ncbi:Wzz/FepE/Etk N-terminal domain-containing protein [Actinoplanes sp. NPDC051633]|uniref:YveK family protein n=1 Tax=Actinoplanes sp. NPDC051633 TaxID=3155670 RepID=UPI003428115E